MGAFSKILPRHNWFWLAPAAFLHLYWRIIFREASAYFRTNRSFDRFYQGTSQTWLHFGPLIFVTSLPFSIFKMSISSDNRLFTIHCLWYKRANNFPYLHTKWIYPACSMGFRFFESCSLPLPFDEAFYGHLRTLYQMWQKSTSNRLHCSQNCKHFSSWVVIVTRIKEALKSPKRSPCFVCCKPKSMLLFGWFFTWGHSPFGVGLWVRRECRERFPRHRGLAIPTCITARAWRTCRDAYHDR